MPHAPTHKAGRHRLALAAALAIAGPLAAAAAPASEPVAYTAAVADEPAPRDESWPGTIGLAVETRRFGRLQHEVYERRDGLEHLTKLGRWGEVLVFDGDRTHGDSVGGVEEVQHFVHQ